jgi:hypothetical protein
MKYELHFDFTAMRESLAEIEQGNPLRMFRFRALHNCVAVANIVRMSTGASMRRGPRTMQEHSTLDFSTNSVVIKIVRR